MKCSSTNKNSKLSRPVNLNIFTIRFPITAIVSISHRISGLLIAISLPLWMCLLKCSLYSEQSFNDIISLFGHRGFRFLLYTVLVALSFHVTAGIRHILLDFHIGESKCAGIFSSYLVFALTLVSALVLGILLW